MGCRILLHLLRPCTVMMRPDFNFVPSSCAFCAVSLGARWLLASLRSILLFESWRLHCWRQGIHFPNSIGGRTLSSSGRSLIQTESVCLSTSGDAPDQTWDTQWVDMLFQIKHASLRCHDYKICNIGLLCSLAMLHYASSQPDNVMYASDLFLSQLSLISSV